MSAFEFNTRLIDMIWNTTAEDLKKKNVTDVESYRQGVRDVLGYAINLFIDMQKEEREAKEH